MSYRHYKPHPLKSTLRPDVRAIVTAEVAKIRAAIASDQNEWFFYSKAKGRISHACGYDAPFPQHDQNQFDLAMATLVREAGL